MEAMEKRVYYGFEGWEDIRHQFEADIGSEPELVYALYERPPYEGNAHVVFRRDGKWMLAIGGHCSCYGLEGQWEPEAFEPDLHLAARQSGKTLVCMSDEEGDYPEATQDNFDRWLSQALENKTPEA